MKSKSENNAETRIIALLESSPDGMQREEIAAALNLTRHTISKYLEVLRAKERIHFRKVGRTKLWKIASADITIRP